MLTRRTHSKSRAGCLKCKQRHIKCDESGPPCKNCEARKTTCVYSAPTAASASLVHRVGACHISDESHSPWQLEKPSRRLLELELMHRWSTSTYRTLSVNAPEHELYKIELPHEALKYDFVLNGLYAIAALDLAHQVETSASADVDAFAYGTKRYTYLAASMDYYGKASAGLRLGLAQINEDSAPVLFILSFLVTVYHLALPYPNPIIEDIDDVPTLRRLITVIDLYRGLVWIAKTNLDRLMARYDSKDQLLRSYEPATPDMLDEETRGAITRLGGLCATIMSGSSSSGEGDDTRLASYKEYVEHIETCFAEDARGTFIGFFASFLAIIDKDFVDALKARDHLAILVLVHWSIMLHRLPATAWWANNVGQDLVAEMTGVLVGSEHTELPGWRESITWARQQVDLPPSWRRESGNEKTTAVLADCR